MSKDGELGIRMKSYESVSKTYLVRRMPVIIRIDGKAFHTFTKGFEKPFDMVLRHTMWETCKSLCSSIQGCKIAYTQSDEISLLLTDYENIKTSAWFDDNAQKMASVSASIATLAFNRAFSSEVEKWVVEKFDCDNIASKHLNATYLNAEYKALFDSRVFNLPKEEVCNYFIWRQRDASKNSVSMVGRSCFSQKELSKRNTNEIQEMLFQSKRINWNDFPTYQKRGACVYRELYKKDGTEILRSRFTVDENIPIFTQSRDYIEKYL